MSCVRFVCVLIECVGALDVQCKAKQSSGAGWIVMPHSHTRRHKTPPTPCTPHKHIRIITFNSPPRARMAASSAARAAGSFWARGSFCSTSIWSLEEDDEEESAPAVASAFFGGGLWGVVGGSGGVRWSQPCQASIKESIHAHPARSPIHTHISTNKPTRLPPPPAQVQKLGDGLARRLERLGLGEPVVVVHHQHGRVLLHLLGGVLSLGRPGGVGSWLMGWLGKSSRCL